MTVAKGLPSGSRKAGAGRVRMVLASRSPLKARAAAWRTIGGVRKYFRSAWEANYGRYLEWLKSTGQIKGWQHEPKVFWFEKIRRGRNNFKPDYCVIELNDTEVFHEVKGFMDKRSATVLKRMAKYYPDVKVILIDQRAYYSIARSVRAVIPDWE